MPSLKPKRFRGRLLRRGRARRAPEAHLRPADLGAPERDATQVADRVHRDLRVVGAGLDAQVAAGLVGIEVVAEERRQPLENGGRRAPMP